MNEEEFKKIAEKTMQEQIMKNLDSSLIFTYIKNLEGKCKELEEKSKKCEYFEEVAKTQSELLNEIKTYPVKFKDDRLMLLVDKTLINNGTYETNFVSKSSVRSKLTDLVEKLESANLGGFADEVRDLIDNNYV